MPSVRLCIDEISDKIIEFQRKYRDAYLLNLQGKTYIFREPTLNEWMQLEKFEFSKLNASSYLVDVLLLYPPKENLSAGEILSLGNEIYKVASKFADDNIIAGSLDRISKDLNSGDSIESVIMIICSAFPSYRPEDVYEFSFDRLMTRLAQAKKILAPPEAQGSARGGSATLPPDATGIARSKSDLQCVLSKHREEIKRFKPHKDSKPLQSAPKGKPNGLRNK